LPEFFLSKKIEYKVNVDDMNIPASADYDMIMGWDLMTELK
jgi:hypothetical protein